MAIATTCADGSPHVVPVWFIYKDGQFYWCTDRASQKAKNLLRDNRIMISVGGKDTVLLRGTAEPINLEDLDFDLIAANVKKYSDYMKDDYINQNTIFYRVAVTKQ